MYEHGIGNVTLYWWVVVYWIEHWNGMGSNLGEPKSDFLFAKY